jgi:hypothetical protein
MTLWPAIIHPFGTEILYDPTITIIRNKNFNPSAKPNCTVPGVILAYYDDSDCYEIVGPLTALKGFSQKIPRQAVEISNAAQDKGFKKKYKTYVRKTYDEIPLNSRIMFDPFYDNNILNLEVNMPNPLVYGIIKDYNAKTKFYTICILISNTIIEVSRDAIVVDGDDYEYVLKQKSVLPIMITIAVILQILLILVYILGK